MGVFYNPPQPAPISTAPTAGPSGFTHISPNVESPRGRSRDIAAEKWDKERADEALFDKIVAGSVNPDTGEVDYASASKALRLKGLSKEADIAEEQAIKTTKARMEQTQQKEMDDLNDRAQALQLVTSGSPRFKQIGMSYLQKGDPDLENVTPADKDGYFYNEHRKDGTVNTVSIEKVWNSLATAKELLTLKQADEQFKFRLAHEYKTDPEKITKEKYLRIQGKMWSGAKIDPNNPADNMNKGELEYINKWLGKDQYTIEAMRIFALNPKAPVMVLKDTQGSIEVVTALADGLRQAVESKKPDPKAPGKGGKDSPLPEEKPNTKIEIEYKGKKRSVTGTSDGKIIMVGPKGEEVQVHPSKLTKFKEQYKDYEPK
jgi:hypothetical protein